MLNIVQKYWLNFWNVTHSIEIRSGSMIHHTQRLCIEIYGLIISWFWEVIKIFSFFPDAMISCDLSWFFGISHDFSWVFVNFSWIFRDLSRFSIVFRKFSLFSRLFMNFHDFLRFFAIFHDFLRFFGVCYDFSWFLFSPLIFHDLFASIWLYSIVTQSVNTVL